jgi:hypothetical protein
MQEFQNEQKPKKVPTHYSIFLKHDFAEIKLITLSLFSLHFYWLTTFSSLIYL